MSALNSHVDGAAYDELWAVRDGAVTHYVRSENLKKGRMGLLGSTLCGRMPIQAAKFRMVKGVPSWIRVATASNKTCNACAAGACVTPSRVVWR